MPDQPYTDADVEALGAVCSAASHVYDASDSDLAAMVPPPAGQAQDPNSPAAKMRSLRAHPHGSACICDDCTARDEAERAGWGAAAEQTQDGAR